MNAMGKPVACLLALALAGGCTVHLKTEPVDISPRMVSVSAKPTALGDQISNKLWGAVADVVRPALVLAVGMVTYRAKEGRWPTSLDEVRGLADLEETWRDELSTLSNVIIEPQPDNSFLVTGTLGHPSAGARSSSPTGIQFTATINMRLSPTSAAGWEPQVDAKITEPKPSEKK
jgi:hypothetical protein